MYINSLNKTEDIYNSVGNVSISPDKKEKILDIDIEYKRKKKGNHLLFKINIGNHNIEKISYNDKIIDVKNIPVFD